MARKTSEEYFHVKPENLNCAQAVLKAFQQEFGVNEELIEQFRAFGGGRAPGGLCGALYAADFLLSGQNKESIKQKFINNAGAATCQALKKEKKTPCTKCVMVADELLLKLLAK